jgi:hypothetical protein
VVRIGDEFSAEQNCYAPWIAFMTELYRAIIQCMRLINKVFDARLKIRTSGVYSKKKRECVERVSVC